MKEVIIYPGTRAELVESAIPSPDALQVVIESGRLRHQPERLEGGLPDWIATRRIDVDGNLQMPEFTSASIDQGDDIAGTVHAIGSRVTDFKPGDRLAAFHQMGASGGSYAENAVAWDHTTFHIPDKISFEGPRGDTIVDYGNGDQAVVTGIREAVTQAGCDKVEYAFDATTASNSWSNIAGALTPTRSITFILFDWQGKGLPDTLKLTQTNVAVGHRSIDRSSKEAQAGLVVGAKEFGHAWYRLLGLGLREGWMTPHPLEVVKGGSKSVGKVLEDLKAGKASAVKYVLRISETEGILSDKLQSEPAFIT